MNYIFSMETKARLPAEHKMEVRLEMLGEKRGVKCSTLRTYASTSILPSG
jgi:hypothetical protein